MLCIHLATIMFLSGMVTTLLLLIFTTLVLTSNMRAKIDPAPAMGITRTTFSEPKPSDVQVYV